MKSIARARLLQAAFAVVVAATLTASLAACSSSDASRAGESSDGLGTLNVGSLAIPAGDLLKWVNDSPAKQAGLRVTWTEFTDYNTPNTSLSNGEIDANLFQNTTFLANYNEATGSDLVSVGEIYLPVAAFYSNTLTSLDQLADGAKIAIPDDPTNEGRALEMLAAKGLIETSENPSVLADVTGNPHKFDFIEIENASLPGVLPDVDTAFVTISFALPAGLKLTDAILVEGQGSKYFNVLATTPELANDPRMQKLYEILISDETQTHIKETFGDQMVPVEK